MQHLPITGFVFAAHSDLVDDLADLRLEAHVEHAVGLVEHQVGGAPQRDLAHLQVVQQAARRRDHHLRAYTTDSTVRRQSTAQTRAF